MAYEDHPAVLGADSAFGYGDIVGQRNRRVLNDAHVVTVLFQDLVNVLPTGTVHETTVNENDTNLRYCSHDDLLSSVIGTL
jgi:hypothetical protein